MKQSLITLALSALALNAMATEQSLCSAAKGSYLTGTVLTAPKFAAATETLQGIKLSHTHVNLRADQDGKTYDVAMDNVYAYDYVKNANAMPASLAAIKVNDRLELCGELYTSGSPGIHWVHSNCGATPSTSAPDGWVKTLTGSTPGSNLEGSESYCYLWN